MTDVEKGEKAKIRVIEGGKVDIEDNPKEDMIYAKRWAKKIRLTIRYMEDELDWVPSVGSIPIGMCLSAMSSLVAEADREYWERNPEAKERVRKRIAKEWGLEVPKKKRKRKPKLKIVI